MCLSGTLEWNGDDSFRQLATYTCGLFSKYVHENGFIEGNYKSECQWNKSWTDPSHHHCQGGLSLQLITSYVFNILALSCHSLEVPPPETNLQLVSDAESILNLDYTMFNFKAPKTISLPFNLVCDETKELQFVLAGRMLRNKLEVIANNDLFHLKVDSKAKELSLWGGAITEENKFVLNTNLDKGEEFLIRNVIKTLNLFYSKSSLAYCV